MTKPGVIDTRSTTKQKVRELSALGGRVGELEHLGRRESTTGTAGHKD